MKKPRISITVPSRFKPVKQPRCTCDQQVTNPNCPARKAGWGVGSDMACSVPPRRAPVFDSYEAVIGLDGVVLYQGGFATKKAARAWAKEWCATVGAALMEKGK